MKPLTTEIYQELLEISEENTSGMPFCTYLHSVSVGGFSGGKIKGTCSLSGYACYGKIGTKKQLFEGRVETVPFECEWCPVYLALEKIWVKDFQKKERLRATLENIRQVKKIKRIEQIVCVEPVHIMAEPVGVIKEIA